MKKTLLRAFLPATLFALILGGCQKNLDSASEEGLRDGTRSLGHAPANCITATSGDANAQNFPFAINDNATGSVKVYNTLTHIVYVFTIGGSQGDLACIRLNDISGTQIYAAGGTTYTYSVPLSAGWTAGTNISQTFFINRQNCTGQGQGVSTTISTSYNLIGICTSSSISADKLSPVCDGETVTLTGSVAADGAFTGGIIHIEKLNNDNSWSSVASAPVTTSVKSVTYQTTTAGTFRATYIGTGSNGYNGSHSGNEVVAFVSCGCPETFTYVDNGDGTYTYTYTPSADMTGANLVFTFAQGVAVTGLGETWTNNGVTQQKTMDLVACTPYTWTVTLTANCSGNSGASNVWTDFKVNNVSKKNAPEDKFVQICQ